MRLFSITQLFAALILCASFAALGAQEITETNGRKPNIVFILADDLGYREVGAFGQRKIKTPNLDRLAASGMRLTQHYSGSPVCAPSRCVLMTGMHPGHAWVRSNLEVKPEGQTPIPASTVTVAELLKKEGYVTAAMGKWGLGPPGSKGDPLNQGFDEFFGYNCQRHAHNYYPTYLWRNRERIQLDNPEFASRQKLPEGADPNDPASYEPYQGADYAPDRIRDQALRFIRENRDRPFFLYYPTIVPHLALQVPNDSLAEYEGKWPDPPYPGGNGYLPHFSPRSAYAAMVTRMDAAVGRVLDLIDELGLDQDTIVIFASDNGPTYTRLGGSDSDFFESAGEFRGLKGSLYEGGIRVPAIVRWPGRIAAESVSERVTGFEDWMPTLLELVEAQEAIPESIDGISFAPVLFGKAQPPRPFLYREFPSYGGQQSVRVGDWKAVRQNLNRQAREENTSPETELYNLEIDPGETVNLRADQPELVDQLEKIMAREHDASELFPIRAIDAVQK